MKRIKATAIFCAAALSLFLMNGCTSSSTETQQIIIPAGASFRAATDSLVNAGVINNDLLFRIYARLKGQDRGIKPGVYLIPPRSHWGAVIDLISDATNSIKRLTIPEGYTLREISPLLASHLEVHPDSVEAALNAPDIISKVDSSLGSLEGYLFPDTYIFPPGTSARDAVSQMTRRFILDWKPEYNARAAALGLSRHEVMTVASIVEKEARVAAERPVIAAVYLNRLRIGMPLQADPTVQYARGSHTNRVLYEDLRIDSKYNTYLYPGLPPGPIASPGSASIAATLAPADVPYLFFVARADGSHIFTNTFAEHTAAIRSVRSNRPE